MCGIAGFCNYAGDREGAIGRMCEALRHRGPDGGGVWSSDQKDVTLGHRRLKVLDLTASGVQPMISKSGRFIITFNGEIYNHKKIAARLLQEGRVSALRGTSDTEVLLEAIEAYGLEEALSMSKGMFAFALYDSKERTLYLVRDRVGEKSLYFGTIGADTFVFASELAAITALEGFDCSINTDVLGLYFIHGYIPAPYSIYRGIHKLDAGMILQIKAPYKDYTITPYWSMAEVAAHGQSHLFTGSRTEAADELERLLKEAIREQMVADVPVGVFMSAGIDSTTVAALAQSALTEPVKTFTIGMPPPMNDEAVFAKKIAAHLGCDHTERYISEEDAKAVIPLLGGIYGEPFADSSQIPTYLVSRIAREKVTVSLGGDAGDELFCGYNSYRSVQRVYRKLRLIPHFIRNPISRLLLNMPLPLSHNNRIRAGLLPMNSAAELYMNALDYAPFIGEISRSKVQIPYKHSQLPHRFLSEPNHQLMLMDMLLYHPDDILVKVDRAAMAVSLETRTPLLDKDVLEFAWSLPIEYKRDKTEGKLVLRDVLYRYVPREMMDRPKQGFGIPIEEWLKDPALRVWAEDLIARDTIIRQDMLDPATVHSLWDEFVNHGRFVSQIWFILMFQTFMDSIQ